MHRFVNRLSDSCLFLLVDVWGWLRYPIVASGYLRRSWRFGRFPRLSVPRTTNDKFFWRKVFDHDHRFTMLSDKLLCKEWVASLDLPVRIAPVLWIGLDAAMIPEDLLQGNVVVKANHGCGTNYFISGGHYDRDELLRLSRRWMKRRHGRRDYQWGYFNIERRLFVEEMIIQGERPIQELKLFTFGDHVARVVHISDRFSGLKASIWEPLDGLLHRVDRKAKIASGNLEDPLPATAERAVKFAREMCLGFDHLRVDFLTDGQELWLGEVTVYNLGGYIPSDGHDPHSLLSQSWDLRRSHFLTNPPATGWRRRYAEALGRVLEKRNG